MFISQNDKKLFIILLEPKMKKKKSKLISIYLFGLVYAFSIELDN